MAGEKSPARRGRNKATLTTYPQNAHAHPVFCNSLIIAVSIAITGAQHRMVAQAPYGLLGPEPFGAVIGHRTAPGEPYQEEVATLAA